MGVPSTHTVSVGDKILAADENTYTRDAVAFLINPPRCSVYNSAAISPVTATWTLHTWDTELYDSDTMHSTVTNTSRLKATTVGNYDTKVQIEFTANATGYRAVQVRKNAAGSAAGGTRVGWAFVSAVTAAAATTVPIDKDVPMTAGDYLEIFIWQSSGAGLATIPGDGDSFASMCWRAST